MRRTELHDLLTRALEAVMGAEGITMPQAFTLKALKEQGGLCRMTDLAAMRLHTPAAMTGIVDRLIHLKLVERRSDASDRRVIRLSLTPQGTAKLASMEKKMHGMMRRFFEGHLGKGARGDNADIHEAQGFLQGRDRCQQKKS